ncbi:coiled-coil domain-containing protein [Facilibium subflavum]|uniref:hypothetical protein n=1 Tax=Facilibium subflavum TaxID=2219058 RepID=UPI0013C2B3B7|nr:hypothetical protein [Facilibium subflavum]
MQAVANLAYQGFKYAKMTYNYAQIQKQAVQIDYIMRAYDESGLKDMNIEGPFYIKDSADQGFAYQIMDSAAIQSLRGQDASTANKSITGVRTDIRNCQHKLNGLKSRQGPYDRYREKLKTTSQQLLDYIKQRSNYQSAKEHDVQEAVDGRNIFTRGKADDAISASIFYAIEVIYDHIANINQYSVEDLIKITGAVESYLNNIAQQKGANQRIPLVYRAIEGLKAAKEEITRIAEAESAESHCQEIAACSRSTANATFRLVDTLSQEKAENSEYTKIIQRHQQGEVAQSASKDNVFKGTKLGGKARSAMIAGNAHLDPNLSLGQGFKEEDINTISNNLQASDVFKKVYIEDQRTGYTNTTKYGKDVWYRDTTVDERNEFARSLAALDELGAVLKKLEEVNRLAAKYMASLGDLQSFSGQQTQPYFEAIKLLKSEIDSYLVLAEPALRHIENYTKIFPRSRANILFDEIAAFREEISYVTEAVHKIQAKKNSLENIKTNSEKVEHELNVMIAGIADAYKDSGKASALISSIEHQYDDFEAAKQILRGYFDSKKIRLEMLAREIEAYKNDPNDNTQHPNVIGVTKEQFCGMMLRLIADEQRDLTTYISNTNSQKDFEGLISVLKASNISKADAAASDHLSEILASTDDNNRFISEIIQSTAIITEPVGYAAVFRQIKGLKTGQNQYANKARLMQNIVYVAHDGTAVLEMSDPERKLYADAYAQQQQSIDAIGEENEKIKDQLTLLGQENQLLQANQSKLETTLSEMESLNTNLSEQRDKLHAGISNLSDQMLKELDSLMSSIEKAKKHINDAAVHNTLIQETEEYGKTESTLAELEQSIASAKRLQDYVRSLIELNNTSNQEMINKITQMSDKISEAKGYTDALKTQINKQKQRIETLTNLNAEMSKELQETKQMNEQFEKNKQNFYRCLSVCQMMEKVIQAASQEKKNVFTNAFYGENGCLTRRIVTKQDFDKFLMITLSHYKAHKLQRTASGEAFLKEIANMSNIQLADGASISIDNFTTQGENRASLRGCRQYVLQQTEQYKGQKFSNAQAEKLFAYKNSASNNSASEARQKQLPQSLLTEKDTTKNVESLTLSNL